MAADGAKPGAEMGNIFREQSKAGAERCALQHARITKLVRNLVKKTSFGNYFLFAAVDIHKTLWRAREVLEKEQQLVEIRPPVVVVGDLYGQFQDLCRIFHGLGGGEMGYARHKYVFLGNYVDHGTQSLESMMLLLLLKILYPSKIILLRGGHETRNVNFHHGFHAEINDRYPEQGPGIWLLFNDVFNNLPLGCLVNGEILCVHGGISPDLKSLDDIRNLPKPLPDPYTCPLAVDLMWADPMPGLHGFKPNYLCSRSVNFGEDAARETCKKIGVRLIIRSNQMVTRGFDFFCNRLVITIFSAPDYAPDDEHAPDQTERNCGAVALVDENGYIGMHVVVPTVDTNFASLRPNNGE